MRVARLLMLGVLLVLTGLCFELAWQAAQDTDDVLERNRSVQPLYFVRASSAAALQAPQTDVLPPQWEEWVPPEPEPAPKVVTKRRRLKPQAAEVAPETSLVAPEDAIRMLLRRKRPALERCYELELKKQASFDGFVVVSVSLSANGRVTDAHVQEATRRDAQVGACIVAQLRQVQLPPLTEEAELIIPIRLEAKKPT